MAFLAPIDNADLDDLQDEVDAHEALTTAHGATADPTASTIVMRDGVGGIAANSLVITTTIEAAGAAFGVDNDGNVTCNGLHADENISTNQAVECNGLSVIGEATIDGSVTTTGIITAGDLPDAPTDAPTIDSGGGGSNYSALYAFAYENDGRYTAIGPTDETYDYYDGGQVIGNIPSTPAGATAVWLVRSHWDDDGTWRRIANVTGLTTYADSIAAYEGDDHTQNYEITLSDGTVTAQTISVSSLAVPSATITNLTATSASITSLSGGSLNMTGTHTLAGSTAGNRTLNIVGANGQSTNILHVSAYPGSTTLMTVSSSGTVGTANVISMGNNTHLTLQNSRTFNSTSPAVTILGTHNETNVVGVGLAVTQTWNQTSTAGGTDLLINRTQTAVGSGTQRLLDLQVGGVSKFNVNTVGTVVVTTATKTLTIAETAGFIQLTTAGTGQGSLWIPNGISVSNNGVIENANASGGFKFLTTSGVGIQNNAAVQFAKFQAYSADLIATSGTYAVFTLNPIYNQASGTAANTDLLINRTQTAVGSGTQYLIDAQVGGVSKFSVDNLGVCRPVGGIITTSSSIFDNITSSSNNTVMTLQSRNFTAAANMMSLCNGTVSNSTGTVVGVRIVPTYNQTSTAAATDLLVNRTETVVGSGAQLLADFQVGSTSKASITNAGQVRATSIGVGNSAAATTLGSVTKKIQVFDASGSSLGYVAVYDAIT